MDFAPAISKQTGIDPNQIRATVRLLDDGNTIPFVARYRKEVTGNLNDEQIAQIKQEVDRQRLLDDRRQTVLKNLEQQGVLDKSLRNKINQSQTRSELEDIYQPYKPKRRTRASIARERGLEPLANIILDQPIDACEGHAVANSLLTEEIQDIETAFVGACDIIAEMISDHADIRTRIRKKGFQFGQITSKLIDQGKDSTQIYKDYYDFSSRVGRLKPYQVLAINRGENEKVLQVKVSIADRDWRATVYDYFPLNRKSPFSKDLIAAVEDAARRLLLPVMERDIRRELSAQAEAHAIHVFVENTRNLLLQPPISSRIVMGIDPGIRTGCKLAVIDTTGKVLETGTIFPHDPKREWDGSKAKLSFLVEKHGISLIAIGNGTASRETEKLIIELLASHADLHYLIVSESGASVYSASSIARSELPDLDVSLRGAVSIARRVQDPLAELVKIDPKSIGVGLYQHDVNQQELSNSLDQVVESVVSKVGVDVNTASHALLTHIAGVGTKMAKNIVNYRDENGPFKNRTALHNVPGLGPKSYEQAAGFLRIREGENPLDQTAIHPESYQLAVSILTHAGTNLFAALPDRVKSIQGLLERKSLGEIADVLDAGLPTVSDIVEQLQRPGRDPRSELPGPILRRDVISLDDLSIGMQLQGTVRNVVDFGAFVDLGIKQDGLLHSSKIPSGIMLRVGDIISVVILAIDRQRDRISLGFVR